MKEDIVFPTKDNLLYQNYLHEESDELTHAVQMFDKNGLFLSNVLIKPSGLVSPSCLFYDFKTDLLCVGSNVNNSVCLYKYLTSQDAITGKYFRF